MVVGIGVDMVEIERIKKSCRHRHFVDKTYSETEQSQFDSSLSRAASDFAGKEAVVKVFGTGFSEGITPDQIEVLHNEKGAPFVILNGRAQEKAAELGITNIHLSITNTDTVTTAFAVGTND